MSNLRIKVKYNTFELELEGDADKVQSEFNDIKQNGLGNLLGKSNYVESTPIVITETLSNSGHIGSLGLDGEDHPQIKTVLMKQLPKSEAEWLLVYAFYSSNFGEKSFSVGDLNDMYESTNRTTDNRKANFSNNLKQLFKSDWITAQNDSDYLLTEKGIKIATEIAHRQHGSSNNKRIAVIGKKAKTEVPNASKEKNPASKNSTSKSYKVLDINFRPEKKISLIDFANKYKLASLPEFVLVIVYYLEKTLQIAPITVNHIHTGLKELKQRIPPTLDQQIRNVKTRKHWLKFDSTNDIYVSIQGTNHLEFDLEKA